MREEANRASVGEPVVDEGREFGCEVGVEFEWVRPPPPTPPPPPPAIAAAAAAAAAAADMA